MPKSILKKLTLLNQITLTSIDAGNKYEVFKNFVEAGIKILNADFGFVWYKSGKSEKYQLIYTSTGLKYTPNYPREKGANYHVQKKKNPLLIKNVARAKFLSIDTRTNAKSVAIIPIVYQNTSYGNIVFGYKKIHSFSKEERSLSNAFGNAMAQAITINRLHYNLEEIKHTLDHTPQPKLIFDPVNLRISYYNKSLLRQIGLNKKQLSQAKFLDIIHPAAYKLAAKRLNHILTEKILSSVFEVTLIGPKKRKIPAEILLQYVSQPGSAPHLLAIIQDLRQRKKSEEQIKHAAFHDALTKLPNRFLFTQRLNALLQDSKQKKRQFAVIFIDLDRFKFFNDTVGHLMGDMLLQRVAQRLKKTIKRTDIVSRLGGDEFVILLANIDGARQSDQIVKRVRKAFQSPIQLSSEQEVYVNFSMGISLYPTDGTDGETLLRNADNALYRAKQLGGNSYYHYENDIIIPQLSNLQMEKNLRDAIRNHELRLHYQPIFDLKTGKVTSIEALLRWQHPTMGFIPPAIFIPYAEESGLIVELGDWVFSECCRQLKTLRAHKINIPVSINVSARELLQKNMIKKMQQVLRKSNLLPKDITMELTETFLIKNMGGSIKMLQEIKKLGFRTSLDDFGTGYASLNYLKRLPVNYIKIDQSFVSGCVTNREDAGIIEAIIAVAHHLDMKVVAEGVEKESQANFLKTRKCDLVQGNFYSPPITDDHILSTLKKLRQTRGN